MIYIDVRTPAEFAEGHYPDVLNHPVELITQGSMPDVARDAEITLYCCSGGRAGMAMQMMQSAGFTNVKNGGGLADL